MLTDTHCHLDFRHYDADRKEVIARAKDAGLIRMLVPGVDLGSSQTATQLASKQPIIFAAVGVHPNSSLSWGKNCFKFNI